MKTDDLREAFLSFFESKGCVRLPGDPLVPRNDPTVLFTPAGMNPFKKNFMGLGDPQLKRATTCQKCLRTGDIEQVGRTPYHHTFFEMLGNFSFGDYFKREAIHWAWEFCTDPRHLGLPPDCLSVSVYEQDQEAFDIWAREIGLPEGRIARGGEEENFWPAGAPSRGPDGICGPCSEIFYHPDTGSPIEIWNLVFTQFERLGPPPNNLRPLPQKNIDTGMGLERTVSVLQKVFDNFEIDIFKPLVEAITDLVKHPYRKGTEEAVRIRRIADHVRAVCFCVLENVLPSNEKQGYVVRRLLRRCVVDGYAFGLAEPFLYRLVPVVASVMQRPYPELKESAERIAYVIRSEEENFLRTLETGVRYLQEEWNKLVTKGEKVFPGESAFRLHATYGFPVELTESLIAERGGILDWEGYRRCLQKHAERSGAGAFAGAVFTRGPFDELRKSFPRTRFVGYEKIQTPAKLVAILVGDQRVNQLTAGGPTAALVLDESPFYGEAGGQVGDSGWITTPEGARFRVQDTQRDDELIVHVGTLEAGTLRVGQQVEATVDAERRAGIRRAHSATHLLHAALQAILGPHATQAGSKVDDDYLRFDFTHPFPLTPEELQRIEDWVNECILEAVPVRWEYVPLEEARRLGAMALFGEKYGQIVRMVSMGTYSRELCGGTHLDSTAQIGLFKITSEESVAAGTRRIIALTGKKALQYVRQQEQTLVGIARALKTPPRELCRRVELLLEENRQLRQRLAQQQTQGTRASTEQLLASAKLVGEVRIVACEVAELTPEEMRHQIDLLRRKASPIAALLASRTDGKVTIVAGLSRDLVERGLSAAEWVKKVAELVGGGGGGKPDMAQAGGKWPEKLPEALRQAEALFQHWLQERANTAST
jgi:alanyl-tRNA synthetase